MPNSTQSRESDTDIILDVRKLRTSFRITGEWHAAVRDISFTLRRNETLALVGESGCGKSVTALSVLGLVPLQNGRVEAERIQLGEHNLQGLSEEEMREIRGNRISMIFQEPMTALNPVLPIGHQVAETLLYHRKMNNRASLKTNHEISLSLICCNLGE